MRRLRGRTGVGATLIEVPDEYADELAGLGERLLYLSGVDEDVNKQVRRTGKSDVDGVMQIVPAATAIGQSNEQAQASASAWHGSAPHGARQVVE